MLLAIMDKWNNLPGVVGINTYGKEKKAIMQVAKIQYLGDTRYDGSAISPS